MPHHPFLRRFSLLAALTALPLAVSAQTVLTTQLANDGANKDVLHWVNFGSLTPANLAASNTYQAAVGSATGLPFQLSFTLQASTSTFATENLGNYPQSRLGQLGNYAQSGAVVLRVPLPPGGGGPGGTLNFSGIAVRNSAGERLQFQWIVADAESTAGDEQITGTTDGGAWTELEQLLDPLGDADNELLRTGNDFTIRARNAGTTSSRGNIAFLVSTQNPGAVSVGFRPGGVEAAAFAVWPLTPVATLACDKTSLVDAPNQESICTVTVTNPPLDSFDIPLTVSTDPRYSTTCGTLSFVGSTDPAWNATSMSKTCTITATPNIVPGDGSVTASIDFDTQVVNNYIVPVPASATGTAIQIEVANDDNQIIAPGPVSAVPTLGQWTLAWLALLTGGMAAGALRHGRRT